MENEAQAITEEDLWDYYLGDESCDSLRQWH